MNKSLLSLSLAALLGGALAAPAARAWQAPVDQIFPDDAPAPTPRLLLHAPGTDSIHAVGAPKDVNATFALTYAKASVNPVFQSLTEPGAGAFWRFPADPNAIGKPAGANASPGLFYKAHPTAWKSGKKSLLKQTGWGFTWTLRYRHPKPYEKVEGWNPLFTVGRSAGYRPDGPWGHGVFLHGGRPVLIVNASAGKGGAAQEGALPSAPVTGDRIDDGAWHLVALRFSKAGADAGSYHGTMSLFVDGALIATRTTSWRPTTDRIMSVGYARLEKGVKYPKQSNWGSTKSRSWLVSVADIDDVRLYAGALGTADLSRLKKAVNAGIRLQLPSTSLEWAPNPAGRVKVKGFETELTGSPLAASAEAVTLGLSDQRAYFNHPGAGTTPKAIDKPVSQFEGMTAHTMMTWITLPELSSEQGLLLYESGTGWKWTLSVDKDGALSMTCTGASGSVSAPASPLGPGRWAAVGISVDADGTLTLQRNLQHQLTMTCDPPPAAKASASLKLSIPNLASVAWLTVVDKAIGLAAQGAVMSPGPLRWFRLPSTKDLSGLHALAATLTGTGTAQFPNGARLSIPLDGTALVPEAGATATPYYTVSLRYRVDSVVPLPSFFGPRLAWFASPGANAILGEQLWIACTAGWASGQTCKLAAYLLAPGKGGAPGYTHLDVKHPWTGGALHRATLTSRFKRTLSAPSSGTSVVENTPLLAIDGVPVHRTHSAAPQQLVLTSTNFTYPSTPEKLTRLEVGMGGLAPGAAGSVTIEDVRVYARVLTSPEHVGATCAQLDCAAVGRTCVAPPDGSGRSAYCGDCLGTHTEVAGLTPLTRECVPRLPFWAPCEGGGQCLSGACTYSTPSNTSSWLTAESSADVVHNKKRCAASPASQTQLASCKAKCEGMGRSCYYRTDKKVYTCGWCRKYYQVLPPWAKESVNWYRDQKESMRNDTYGSIWAQGVVGKTIQYIPNTSLLFIPDAMRCGWAPLVADGEACDIDDACESASCREETISGRRVVSKVDIKTLKYGPCPGNKCAPFSYQQWNVAATGGTKTTLQKRKVCATQSTSACTGPKRRSSVTATEPVTRPDGTKTAVHTCAAGPDQPCAPNYLRGAEVLSWQACKKAVETIGFQPKWSCSGCWGFPKTTRLKDFQATSGLNIDRLRRVFVNDGGKGMTPGLMGKLQDAGVGPLLIRYAQANQTEKQKMIREYGYFEPLSACAESLAEALPQTATQKCCHFSDNDKCHEKPRFIGYSYVAPYKAVYKDPPCTAGVSTFVYHRRSNDSKCLRKLLYNGSTCPPKGEPGDGNSWCRSGYCDRATSKCADVDVSVEKLEGNGGNKSGKGKSAVKFGMVRVDNTSLQVKKSAKPGAKPGDLRYVSVMRQKYVPCVLGKALPSAGLLEVKLDVDRSGGAACSTTDLRTFVLGIQATAPSPPPVAGSCTGYSKTPFQTGTQVCDQSDSKPSCTPIDVPGLEKQSLSKLIPAVNVCRPIPNLPEAKKVFYEALVPIGVRIGLTLDPCVAFSIGVDDHGMPQVGITPSIAVGVDARGGIALDVPPVEIWGGVKLALTLAALKFPVLWGLQLDQVFKAADGKKKKVVGMFEISVIQQLGVVLELLPGEFSVFAEVSVDLGFFSITEEWTLPVFSWPGLSFSYNFSKPLSTTRLDLQAPFTPKTKGPATAQCNTNICYQ